MNETISVSALNRYTKMYLESDEAMRQLLVEGEILNCKKYPSGHIYFSLKDETASVRAVMFANYASRLKFIPKDGIKVIVPCSVSFYEKDGSFRLMAYGMIEQGTGDINKKYIETKNRLEKEGFFSSERKRPLPYMPKKVIVIASEAGAVIHDIHSVAMRKYPFVFIMLLPVRVQGEGAVDDINKAIKYACTIEDAQLIIFARGGGSKEDLWCFNDESVVRNAASLKVPYISAVGHETDFTLLDFAADIRAATPTAAADLAFPDCSVILATYSQKIDVSARFISDRLNTLTDSITEKRAKFADRINIIFTAGDSLIQTKKLVYDALSPKKVLKRGYSIISDQLRFISSIDDITEDKEINVRLRDGSFSARVLTVNKGENND